MYTPRTSRRPLVVLTCLLLGTLACDLPVRIAAFFRDIATREDVIEFEDDYSNIGVVLVDDQGTPIVVDGQGEALALENILPPDAKYRLICQRSDPTTMIEDATVTYTYEWIIDLDTDKDIRSASGRFYGHFNYVRTTDSGYVLEYVGTLEETGSGQVRENGWFVINPWTQVGQITKKYPDGKSSSDDTQAELMLVGVIHDDLKSASICTHWPERFPDETDILGGKFGRDEFESVAPTFIETCTVEIVQQ